LSLGDFSTHYYHTLGRIEIIKINRTVEGSSIAICWNRAFLQSVSPEVGSQVIFFHLIEVAHCAGKVFPPKSGVLGPKNSKRSHLAILPHEDANAVHRLKHDRVRQACPPLPPGEDPTQLRAPPASILPASPGLTSTRAPYLTVWNAPENPPKNILLRYVPWKTYLPCADCDANRSRSKDCASWMESMKPKHMPVMEPMVAPKATLCRRSDVWYSRPV
jgi:hypothetical protein